MIHELSRRGTHRFQAVNCAALPDTLFESEIFGYEKGAFTGAHDRKPGRLELAEQRHAVPRRDRRHVAHRAGQAAARARRAAVRAPRRQHVDRGELPPDLGDQPAARRSSSATARFREDLYYRVNAFSIRLPSLRGALERHPGPRAALPRALLRGERPAARRQERSREKRVRSADAVPLAGQHPRAREHGLARGAVVARARRSAPADIEFLHATETPAEASRDRLPSLRRRRTRPHRARARERVNWNKKQAAAVLEISRGTLYRKIVEYGLEEAPPASRNRTTKHRQSRDFGTPVSALQSKDLAARFAIGVSETAHDSESRSCTILLGGRPSHDLVTTCT